MDSFEALIGKQIDDVALNESTTFFIAPLKYLYKNCGRRYPASKFKLADLDYFNLIEFSELFKHDSILIIWYDEDGLITDLEHYYLSNDFDVLFKDYYIIKKAIDNGEAHNLTEGDTRYLGASRLNEKVEQPNSDRLANKRELVLKKRYLQKIINEMGFKCNF
ncbi:MAG: hypothetical protein E7Z77_00055 [Methanobrevibacter sp.]|uniref:hypothetical protein n=1 Tax=Methanobrevibacter sp. TaxID=66852 RepID=UPI0025D54EC1|nr:hypothetical protein [Methanobrevibacter sp.]MBE6507782.1 hypothetical protein [Methanobrevibacter sp.]